MNTDFLTVEASGFICRTISVKHVTEKPIYTAGFTLIVLAPVLMAAACYIVFVRRNGLHTSTNYTDNPILGAHCISRCPCSGKNSEAALDFTPLADPHIRSH